MCSPAKYQKPKVENQLLASPSLLKLGCVHRPNDEQHEQDEVLTAAGLFGLMVLFEDMSFLGDKKGPWGL